MYVRRSSVSCAVWRACGARLPAVRGVSTAGDDGSDGASARAAVARVCAGSQKRRDPFLREGTATSRFFRAYRTRLPFPARMFGVSLLGFTVGMVIEVFACRTHLYESVMMKKDARRHELDEFVVDFRQNVERWQREDMSKRRGS
ncbi:hypothetical protein ABL78_8226 [Leptomonas seymouri]|uniref:Transmembrane protein n=1 Tax=Leptomonas seymouri TaxID=5684 RepID=A0A0N1PAT4_LEPSE|nr:hypothetical protein ABL78_8226 [Leptomonas seymouri]|eukprot:KPI82762.1 hypothetical protein ABL78_8226 [Leptomonas seymouri]